VTTDTRPAPQNPLPAGVLTMWRWEAVIASAGALVAAFAVAAGADVLMPGLPLAVALGGVGGIVAGPRVRHARWRWELHEEELDLLHGVWSVERTIVPLTRIQHVAVHRSGWTNLFGLVVLKVHTAAGGTTIPGLGPAQADDVRDRILARLRTPDDL
jgi:membrane protein YdbS with pleckstrin-like domain